VAGFISNPSAYIAACRFSSPTDFAPFSSGSPNIGTFVRAWTYPAQMHGWSMVSLGKFGSWFLLLIISYAIVAATLRPRPYEGEAEADAARPNAQTGRALEGRRGSNP
jgi:Protein of unknown function (DUF817)